MKMISGNQIVIAGERFRVGDVVTTSEKGISLVSAWVLPFQARYHSVFQSQIYT
jgi:hypothetical protein